ncbi:MAG: hypothetical protein HW397_499 [Dehalococcoidia bacterium]|nr:hypothetical protein [Dehalococcoidia bacterium]
MLQSLANAQSPADAPAPANAPALGLIGADRVAVLLGQAQALIDMPMMPKEDYTMWMAATDEFLTTCLGPDSFIAKRVRESGALSTRFYSSSPAEVRTKLGVERTEKLKRMKACLESLLAPAAVAKVPDQSAKK